MIDSKKTKKQLIEELERYRRFFDNAPLGYQSLDISGNFIEVNDTWCKTLGYPRDEIIGRNFSEFLHPDFREHFKENFPKFKSMGYILGVEFEMIKKDGTELIVSFNGRIGYNEDGSFRQTHCMLSDITERKLAESQREAALEALRESEESLQSVFRAVPTGIGVVVDRVMIQVNQRMCEITGYSEEDLIGQGARMLYVTDEDFDYVGREKYAQIRDHGTGSVETRWRRKDGEIIDVLLSSTPLNLKDLSKGVTFTALDITERKRAEEELNEERKRAQMYLDIAGVMFVTIDAAGIVTLVNQKTCEVLEYAEEELVGRSWFDTCLPQRLRETVKEVSKRLLRGEIEPAKYYENPVLTRSGAERIIAWHNTVLRDDKGSIIGHLSSGEDITERKQAESQREDALEAMRESESMYRRTIENASGVPYQLDLVNNRYLFIGSGIKDLFGITQKEFSPQAYGKMIIEQVVTDSDGPGDHIAYSEAFGRGEVEQFKADIRIQTSTGGIKWISDCAVPIRDNSDKVVGSLGILLDITERKRAEDNLRESKERFEKIIARSPIPMVVTDAKGDIEYFNDKFIEVFGYTIDDVSTAEQWWALVYPDEDYRQLVKQSWEKAIAEATEKGIQIETQEWDFVCKDRSMRRVEFDMMPLGEISIIALNDITERKRAEEKIHFLSQVTEQVTDSIITTDLNYRITYVNQAFQELYGYSKEEMIGRSPDFLNASSNAEDLQSKIYETISKGKEWSGEAENLKKDGSIFLCELTVYPIMDDDGNVFAYAGSQRDVTERKHAEEALRDSEEKFRAIGSSANDAIIVLDDSGDITFWNKAAERMFGRSYEDVVGKNFHDLAVPQKYHSKYQEGFRRFNEAGEGDAIGKTVELYAYRKNGTEFPVELSLSGFLLDGKWHSIGIVRDITERKRAEIEIEAQQYYLSKAQEMSSIGTWELDLIKNKLIWTEENYRIFGVPLGTELNYEIFLNRVHPDDREYVNREWKAAIGGKPYDIEHRLAADGEIKWVREKAELNFDKDGQAVSAIGFTQDITQRRQAQEALQASEERFRTQMVQSPLVMEIYDLEGQQIEVNRAYEKLWGFPASTTVNKFNVLKSKEVEDTGLMKYVKRAYAGKAVTVPEYEFDPTGETESGGPGRVRWLSTKIYPLKDSSGNVTSIVISHEDITDRKQAEYEREIAVEALRESEEKHRSIAERIYDVIIVARLDGEISYVSPSVRRVFGYQPKDLVGKKITEFVPEAEIPHVIETFQLSAAGSDVEGYHSEFLKKDGSYASIELNAVPIYKNDKIIGAQAIIRDITETKRLQELESRAERLETAGTIAGQVAHDFNNLLAPIMAYPEFIHEELPHDNKAHAYLDAIEEAAAKIADINQDLLTMGRRGHYNQTVLDINRVVLQAAQEMESRTKTVAVELELCKDIEKIKGGTAQIHRMLTNLLVNAQDAMEGIGQVTIITENYYADDTSIAFGRVPKGEYVKLTVTDNGCGIPDNIIHKILDPFFTSKTTDKKRGSGLGLSVVDAVIRDHNGYLDLSTRLGGGTSFYIYFPITHDLEDVAGSLKNDRGNEKVLVIDDDAIQRDVSSRLLEKLGYIVTTIESGEKGIEFIKNNPQDLVILDMIMPTGIDGTETFRRILEIYPEQKAIFISGFSETDRILEGQKMGAGSFVKKPLTKKAIAAAVRKELDRDKKIGVS